MEMHRNFPPKMKTRHGRVVLARPSSASMVAGLLLLASGCEVSRQVGVSDLEGEDAGTEPAVGDLPAATCTDCRLDVLDEWGGAVALGLQEDPGNTTPQRLDELPAGLNAIAGLRVDAEGYLLLAGTLGLQQESGDTYSGFFGRMDVATGEVHFIPKVGDAVYDVIDDGQRVVAAGRSSGHPARFYSPHPPAGQLRAVAVDDGLAFSGSFHAVALDEHGNGYFAGHVGAGATELLVVRSNLQGGQGWSWPETIATPATNAPRNDAFDLEVVDDHVLVVGVRGTIGGSEADGNLPRPWVMSLGLDGAFEWETVPEPTRAFGGFMAVLDRAPLAPLALGRDAGGELGGGLPVALELDAQAPDGEMGRLSPDGTGSGVIDADVYGDTVVSVRMLGEEATSAYNVELLRHGEGVDSMQRFRLQVGEARIEALAVFPDGRVALGGWVPEGDRTRPWLGIVDLDAATEG